MKKIILTGVVAWLLSLNSAFAGTQTGTIHSLHVNLETNKVHVYLVGKPSFDGGACSYIWTGNTLDDTKFMTFIWPLLLHAKSKQEQIRIDTNGCNGKYPKIFAVDVLPRE